MVHLLELRSGLELELGPVSASGDQQRGLSGHPALLHQQCHSWMLCVLKYQKASGGDLGAPLPLPDACSRGARQGRNDLVQSIPAEELSRLPWEKAMLASHHSAASQQALWRVFSGLDSSLEVTPEVVALRLQVSVASDHMPLLLEADSPAVVCRVCPKPALVHSKIVAAHGAYPYSGLDSPRLEKGNARALEAVPSAPQADMAWTPGEVVGRAGGQHDQPVRPVGFELLREQSHLCWLDSWPRAKICTSEDAPANSDPLVLSWT